MLCVGKGNNSSKFALIWHSKYPCSQMVRHLPPFDNMSNCNKSN